MRLNKLLNKLSLDRIEKLLKDRNKLLLIALAGMLFVSVVILSTVPRNQSFLSRTGEFFRGETSQPSTTPTTNSRGQRPQAVTSVNQTDYVIGDPENARIILIEYADLNCVFCAQFHQSMQQVVNEFGNDVAWIYRHFPLSNSQLEAQAAECVGQQAGNEAFWQFVDEYFTNRIPVNTPRAERTELLEQRANDLGVDIADCLESGQAIDDVEADYQNASEIGLEGTPSTVLIVPETNEYEVLAGAYSAEDMIDILGSYLR